MPLEFIQNNILLIAVAVSSGLMLVWPAFRRGGSEVTPAQATQLINREQALVIDVRDSAEYVTGHLPDARNMPLKDLQSRAGDLEKDKPLILVCASGVRSGQACVQLKKLGFEKLYNLDGGVGAWERAGLPLKKGTKK